MHHLTLTWPAAQKLIRSKQVFIVKDPNQINEFPEDNVPNESSEDNVKEEAKKKSQFVFRDAKYKIQEGDRLCYPKTVDKEAIQSKLPEVIDKKKENQAIKKIKDMIQFENEHIIVINKDHGVPSQMGSGLNDDNSSHFSIDTMLQYYCPDSEDLFSGGRLIHRLDRKTSGLMVLAKNKEMAKVLGDKFKQRQIYKAYYALICGIPSIPRAIVRQSFDKKEVLWEIETLDKHRNIYKSPDYSQHIEGAKLDMISKYEVLSVSQLAADQWINRPQSEIYRSKIPIVSPEQYSYVKFEIETGKKHQIRLMCNYALQKPIFGDDKYGYDQEKHSNILQKQVNVSSILGKQSIMLHAGQLEIPIDPECKETMQFTAELKGNMESLLDTLHIPKIYYV
ncbi:ribosomal large subunit pseudouridine synthase c [Stylonychia lemnae]|uniref:Ribosomal large subunit pseudouridine synthase c n=1 Tax=Stylonychia lemnae TaxID=5949 RepID=A0A078AKT3_STYLE|nr:ribosomal large subunit pseudouridine synthase c [Stylonychia lemnae]|eukprot:CDW82985.1 ribosomal large subunit pseudouridine synthase c [Stylonychia lemnae]